MEEYQIKARRVALLSYTIIVIGCVILASVVTGLWWKQPNGDETIVLIKGYRFQPENIQIQPGTKVVWKNEDNVDHTVTMYDGYRITLDSGNIRPGESYSHKFTEPGSYPYRSKLQPYMEGNVTVIGQAGTISVDIKNFKFSPADLTVHVGTTVTWTNSDSMVHTVTSLAGAPVGFDSNNIAAGGTYSYKFDQLGTYPYYCKIHPYMLGNVTVIA